MGMQVVLPLASKTMQLEFDSLYLCTIEFVYMSIKKNNQLGMHIGTASHRLVKDLLFAHIKDTPCFQCGGKLSRQDFSIEHKKPWLDSEDPIGLFFDLDNISFSHLSCNISAARRSKVYINSLEQKRQSAQRWRDKTPAKIKAERRKERYQRTGR
jgi:hypothetical protein